MLAIVDSMCHWCHYLEGSCHLIQVLSDHKNLTSFMTIKVLNHRQARWAERLANYVFVLLYTLGKENSADGLSRCPNYFENPLPQGALIPPQALRFLPLNSTDVHAAIVLSLL